MEEKILEVAFSQGIWSALTVLLILYILRTQEKRDNKQEEREINYQNIISKLTEKFNLIEEVKKDIEEIKIFIKK